MLDGDAYTWKRQFITPVTCRCQSLSAPALDASSVGRVLCTFRELSVLCESQKFLQRRDQQTPSQQQIRVLLSYTTLETIYRNPVLPLSGWRLSVKATLLVSGQDQVPSAPLHERVVPKLQANSGLGPLSWTSCLHDAALECTEVAFFVKPDSTHPFQAAVLRFSACCRLPLRLDQPAPKEVRNFGKPLQHGELA